MSYPDNFMSYLDNFMFYRGSFVSYLDNFMPYLENFLFLPEHLHFPRSCLATLFSYLDHFMPRQAAITNLCEAKASRRNHTADSWLHQQHYWKSVGRSIYWSVAWLLAWSFCRSVIYRFCVPGHTKRNSLEEIVDAEGKDDKEPASGCLRVQCFKNSSFSAKKVSISRESESRVLMAILKIRENALLS